MKPLNYGCLLGAVLFFSCTKDTVDNNNPQTESNKVKTITLGSPDNFGNIEKDSMTLFYDSQSRLNQMKYINSLGEVSNYSFSYEENKITETVEDKNGWLLNAEYLLNSNSKADSIIITKRNNSASMTKYKYNTLEQLTAVFYYVYSESTGSQLTNISNYQFNGDGTLARNWDDISDYRYEYYPDKLGTFSNPFPVDVIFAYESFNIVVEPLVFASRFVKTITNAKFPTTEKTNYFYSFDEQKRLIKQEADDGSFKTITGYTYY